MSIADQILEYLRLRVGDPTHLRELYELLPDHAPETVRARVYESRKVVRVGRGLYVYLRVSITVCERSDALAALEAMHQAGLLFDLLVLDPPYRFGGQRGGSKGKASHRDVAKFPTMKLPEWRAVVPALLCLLQQHAQVYTFMPTGTESARKVQQWLGVLGGSLPKVGEGEYWKLYQNGEPCQIMGREMPPEGLHVYSPGGELRKCSATFTLQFRLERPGDYPTKKPDEMLEQIVRQATLPGEAVLDPYVGSGTTARACEELGRHCLAVDIQSHPGTWIKPKQLGLWNS